MALGMADWHLTKFKSYDVSFLVFGFSKTLINLSVLLILDFITFCFMNQLPRDIAC